MTIEELRSNLTALVDAESWDKESLHQHMDAALIEYIGDEEIKKIFKNAELWYA